MFREVVLFSVNRMGRNGDRATVSKPYKDYEIHVRESEGQELDKSTLVETVYGYDNFNSHILDERGVANLAFDKARKLQRIITGSEQGFSQEYSMNAEEARKSAFAKLTRQERLALGFE